MRHQQPPLCMCNRHAQHNTSNTDLPRPKPVPSTVFPVSVTGNSILAVIQDKNLEYLTSLLHSTFNLSANPVISTSKYSQNPATSQPFTAPFLGNLSHLDYSDRLLADLSFSAFDPLQPIFNRAAKVILLSVKPGRAVTSLLPQRARVSLIGKAEVLTLPYCVLTLCGLVPATLCCHTPQPFLEFYRHSPSLALFCLLSPLPDHVPPWTPRPVSLFPSVQ